MAALNNLNHPNNPVASDPETDIEDPEMHRHVVPIVNIDPPQEDLGTAVPLGEDGNADENENMEYEPSNTDRDASR